MAVDSQALKLSLYRRSEAKQLLEWARTIEEHKQPLEVWINKPKANASASATASPNPLCILHFRNPPERKGN